MKKKLFKTGDRVGFIDSTYDNKVYTLRFDEYEEPCFGIITAVGQGIVTVKWDDTEYDPSRETPLDLEDQKLLYLEDDFKKKYSKLEADFKELEKEVTLKVKEAGKLLREANKIAKKTGHNLVEMSNACSVLLDAMDSCGWNTSSFGC